MKFTRVCLFAFLSILSAAMLSASSSSGGGYAKKSKKPGAKRTAVHRPAAVAKKAAAVEKKKEMKVLKHNPAPSKPDNSGDYKLAVIVNSSNPLTNISTKQIELIFSGDTLNWRALYGEDILLRAYIPAPGSKHYNFFHSKVMNSREFGPATEIINGHNETLALVASKENAIAFVKYPFYKTEGVKVLAIDGVPPKADNYSLKAAPAHAAL